MPNAAWKEVRGMFLDCQAAPTRGSKKYLLLGRSPEFTPESPGKTRPRGAAGNIMLCWLGTKADPRPPTETGAKSGSQRKPRVRVKPGFTRNSSLKYGSTCHPWISASSPDP